MTPLPPLHSPHAYAMTVQQIAARVGPSPVLPGATGASTAQDSAFADLLARASERQPLTVSAHAAQRLAERDISFTDALRQQIDRALVTLDAKGAQDALLVGAEAAFVVNVPNRTLVTALAPADMRDRAVTQIDSALIL